jgi:hypothetical protein
MGDQLESSEPDKLNRSEIRNKEKNTMPRTKKPVALETVITEALARLRHDIDTAVINAFKEGLQNGSKVKRRKRTRRNKPTAK